MSEGGKIKAPKVFLIILDGWGWSPIRPGNLLLEADTPGLDTLLTIGRWLLLKTASSEVGLPWGSVGDSELGHYNLGTGRIVVAHHTNEPGLVAVDDRVHLMDNSASEHPASEQAIFEPKHLQVPTSLGTILDRHRLGQVKIGAPDQELLLTEVMNGYPARRLVHERWLPLTDPDDLIKRLTDQPSTLNSQLIVMNLAQADRAGHAGDLAELRKAVQAIDRTLQSLAKLAFDHQAVLYLTSDHGNIEAMTDPYDHLDPNHTTNPVVLLRVDLRRRHEPLEWQHHPHHKERVATTMPTGLLADVTPTILDELGLPIPTSMVGISLRRQLHR